MSDANATAAVEARAQAIRAWIEARPWKTAFIAGIGGFITIAVLALVNSTGALPLIIAPFGASCALVFGAHASPFAKPRNVIGGHLVSATLGLLALTFVPYAPLAMALGVGLAIAGMILTDTMHPPAGANPIVIALTQASGYFLIAPVLIGACLIVGLGVLFHQVVTGHNYKWG